MVFIWTGLFSFYKITNETNTAEYIHTPSKAVPTDVSADTFNDYTTTLHTNNSRITFHRLKTKRHNGFWLKRPEVYNYTIIRLIVSSS